MIATMSSFVRVVVVTGMVELQLAVHPVAPDVAEVVPLLVEEEAVDQRLGGLQVGGVAGAELLVDDGQGVLFGLHLVLRNGLRDDRLFVPLLQEEPELPDVRLADPLDVVFVQDRAVREQDLAGLLVHDVAADDAPLVRRDVHLRDVHLLDQVEELQDLVVGRIAQRAEERRDREFLLPVDVHVHHVVDVGRELHPGAAERDDARGIDRRPVGMDGLAEEYARGAVQLADDHALGAVDDERAAVRHGGQVAQVDVLLDGVDVRVAVLRLLREAQLGLHRDGVRQAAFLALRDRVLRLLDVILDELQEEVLPGIGHGEVHLEDGLQPLVPAARGLNVRLQEALPGLQLDVQQVRRIDDVRNLSEGDPLVRIIFHEAHSYLVDGALRGAGRIARCPVIKTEKARPPLADMLPQIAPAGGSTTRPAATDGPSLRESRTTSARRWPQPLRAPSSASRPRPSECSPSRPSERRRPGPWLPSSRGPWRHGRP